MTVEITAPSDSGDDIADLADFVDNLRDEDHARLVSEGEQVTLMRRRGARSFVWQDGRYQPPAHVVVGPDLPGVLAVLDDTGWHTYNLDERASLRSSST